MRPINSLLVILYCCMTGISVLICIVMYNVHNLVNMYYCVIIMYYYVLLCIIMYYCVLLCIIM